jgi:DedD protein
MNEAIKQRLVGGVVLLALGVIFIPIVLDFDNGRELASKETLIPPRPDNNFESVKIPLQKWRDKTVADVAPEVEQPPRDTINLEKTVATNAAHTSSAREPSATNAGDDNAASPAPARDLVAATRSRESAPATEKVAKKPVEQKKTPVEPRPVMAGPATGTTAWAVQVGSFSQRKNAEALRNKLLESGYRAYVMSFETNGKTVVRVRVGPELVRAEADQLQKKLQKELSLQTMVVKH